MLNCVECSQGTLNFTQYSSACRIQYNPIKDEKPTGVIPENFKYIHLLCVILFICAFIVLTFEVMDARVSIEKVKELLTKTCFCKLCIDFPCYLSNMSGKLVN